MKKNKTAISLVARLIGGITFLGVFILNVMLFVQSDNNGLSLETLKAYALTGGTGNEEETSTDYDHATDRGKTTTYSCELSTDANGVITYGSMTETCVGTECVGSGTVACTYVPYECEETECK